ncbi:MAG: hypothetical protein GXY48_00905 [Methanomicrobiales archaeon]|nr:hypothetical protein [Methanomicrobiales archaeon]
MRLKIVTGVKSFSKPEQPQPKKSKFLSADNAVVEPRASFYRGEITGIDSDDSVVTIDMHETAYSDCEEEIIISSGEITIHSQLYAELDAVTRVWATYVGGLSFNTENELQIYEEAKRLWSRCREGFKFVGRIQSAPDSVSNLKWYTEGNTDIGFTNSAFEFLKYLVYWTSRPKAQVEFTIPLNGYMKSQNGIMTGRRNLDLELLEAAYFSDQIYTNGQKRRGYVTKIEPDTKKSEIKIGLILEPDDYSEVIVERGIPLNDPMPQIVESGARDTIIVETGV